MFNQNGSRPQIMYICKSEILGLAEPGEAPIKKITSATPDNLENTNLYKTITEVIKMINNFAYFK